MQLCWKGDAGENVFPMNSAKHFRASVHKTPPSYCFLCFSENFEKASFVEHASVFHVQVAEFQPSDTVKTIWEVLSKYFMQELQVAIRRR